MNGKLVSEKTCNMRRSGKRIVALSVLLIVCLLLSAWLHPPAAALDEWEFDRIPWNVWVVMTKFISSPVHHLFLTTPLAISEQTQSCEHHTALSGVYLVVPALVPFYLFDIYDRYLPQALSFLSTVQRPLFSAEKDYFHPGSLFSLTAATFCHGLHAYGGLASCA